MLELGRSCLVPQVLFHSFQGYHRSRRPEISCYKPSYASFFFVPTVHAWFRDVLALGHFKRIDLARRVFGTRAVEVARKQIVEPLGQWGYAGGTALIDVNHFFLRIASLKN
jgi:hypothetical protein